MTSSSKVTQLIRNRTSLGGVSGKESAGQSEITRDVGLIPGWGRSPGGGNGNLL